MSTNGNTCYRKGNTMNAPNHRLVDAVSDVYAPTPTDGSIIKWTSANQRWENAPGFGSYFKSGYVDMDATSTAWNGATYGRRLYWGQAGSLMVLFIPATTYPSAVGGTPGPITFTTTLPNYLWPQEPVVDHKLGVNLNVRADASVTISTTGTITIWKGILIGGILGRFDVGLFGEACGGDMMYIAYKINFVAGSAGPIPPTPIPALRFIDLTDTQAAYMTPFSLLRVKAANNGVSEFDLQATLPAVNQLRLTSGTSALTVTSSSTIDQDLATTASPQFANLTVNNKLTVTGPIDPTGIQLTKQSVNPLDSKSIWTDGTIVYFGQIPIGSNVAWWCSVDKTIQAGMKSTATTTLTGAGGVGELATAVTAALDGDVIEIQSNLGYSPITLPTAKRLTIRVAQGYGAYLTGANCCTLVNGCRDITIIGLGWDTCTTTDTNALGSAISLQQSAVVTRIIFAQCNLRACAGSAVMMSYHQTIGGDNYATANAYPAEFSTNIAFVDCSFNKATTDGGEGAALALRGVEGAYVKNCLCNCQGVGGRGIQLQNCLMAWVEGNYVTGGAGTANGEGIKLDRLGAPAYLNSGYFIRNVAKANKQGIDLDDFDSAVAIGNRCFKNTSEGLCLCGVGQTTVASNVCWENNDGIAIEIGVSSYKLYNNTSFLNTTNNYRLDGGGSPNDSNLTSQTTTTVGADSVPFTTSGVLTSKNVNDALNEIAAISAATDINGFSEANRLIRTLSIVNGATPTFTIAGGPYQYYQHGTLYTRTTDTVAITNVQGLHYFYYNGATLTHTTSATMAIYRDYVWVGMCYWEADLGTPANSKYLFLGDETHAFMDWATHWLEHTASGSKIPSTAPITLDGFTIGDGSLAAHAELGFSGGGQLLDEDLTHTIPGTAAPATIPVFYRLGATAWKRVSPSTNAPVTNTGTGRLAYNSFSSPNWALTEVTNGRYMLYHIFATNGYIAGDRMISIMGINEYTSVNLARTGANNELSTLKLGGLPAVEWVAVGTVIYQTDNTYANTWKARVVLTDTGANYVNWVGQTINAVGSTPGSHHSLADLPTYDDHPQYALVSGSISTTGRVGDILPMDEIRMFRLPASGDAIKIGNPAAGTYLQSSFVNTFSGTSGGTQRSWQMGTYYDGTTNHPAYDWVVRDAVAGNISLYCSCADWRVNAPFGFASTLTGAAAKILDFGVGGSVGDYSYIGGVPNYSFGVKNGSGVFVSSDDYSSVRIGNSGANYFQVTTGTVPVGSTMRFGVYGDGQLTVTNTATWPHLTVDGTFAATQVWYPDSTVNGTEQAITWGAAANRHTGFAMKYIGANLESIVRAHGDLILAIDASNSFTTKKLKVVHNAPDETGAEILSVAEDGTLSVTNTITSSLAGTASQILAFTPSNTNTRYSYIGPSIDNAFYIEINDTATPTRSHIVGLTSDAHQYHRISDQANYWWAVVSGGTAPLGTLRFRVYGDGTGIQIASGQKVDEFSTDGTLGGNSNTALPTEQAVKTYVDSMFSTGTFSVTFTGCSITLGPMTVKYDRSKNIVTAVFPGNNYGTAGSNGVFTSTTAANPVALRPATQQIVPIYVASHDMANWGTLWVNTDGTFEIRNRNAEFQASAPAGIYFTSCCVWNLS